MTDEHGVCFPSESHTNRNISPFSIIFKNSWAIFKMDEIGIEISKIAFPAALALAADPIASLVDTAFIGQIGPVELAAVGVSIALFNQVSRIAIFPLLSVTTSFVAEEDAVALASPASSEKEMGCLGCHTQPYNSEEQIGLMTTSDEGHKKTKFSSSRIENQKLQRRPIPSASSALFVGAILGLLQSIFLIALAGPLLSYMGLKPDSTMLPPAERYLILRSLGAPATILSLAMQGIFRGLKDTQTPLYATMAGDVTNIILDQVFIFAFRLGVSGAAIAHVISQYLIAIILFWRLVQIVDLIPPNFKDLMLDRFLKNGFLLLIRVMAVTFCVTLATSMAARLGPTQMAAFQVCLQVWLTTSLLADGLAIAGQAILASAFAKNDFERAKSTASRVLQLGFVLGLILSFILQFGLEFTARMFTKDFNVLSLIKIAIPFVVLTQPINALAFVFDGINFGASDFAYSAFSMVIVAIISILCLLALSSNFGFIGIWVALTIYMCLRALAGFLRIGTGSGPWNFLRS